MATAEPIPVEASLAEIRREIWQLQDLLVGAGLGFVVGRFSRSDDRSNSHGQRGAGDRP